MNGIVGNGAIIGLIGTIGCIICPGATIGAVGVEGSARRISPGGGAIITPSSSPSV